MDKPTKDQQPGASKDRPKQDDDRRRAEALQKIGEYGAYTAPTMLALLTSQTAAAIS